jgi:hypothetical protein
MTVFQRPTAFAITLAITLLALAGISMLAFSVS